MGVWRTFMTAVAALALLACGYVIWRFHKFSFVRKIGEKSRLLAWLVCLLPLGVSALFLRINVFSVAIVLLHLALAFALCDLIGWIIRKITKKKPRRYWAGAAALALAAIYLALGWYNAHHVRVTRYELVTDKELGGDLRVAALADSHLGVTLDGAGFARQMERVQAEKPDIVVIVGDFVDDDSPKEDMLEACRALGRLEAPCGVYYVYGNHDRGYFQYRNFSAQELREALAENGGVILEDRAIEAGGRCLVIGRQDRSVRGRAGMEALTGSADDDLYQIVLDHQPNDYDAEAESGVDLVLSGHTHGGHIFPAGLIGLATGANDRVYGMERRGDTAFIVTSGISGWAIPFKTGTFSEFLVIDIKEK